MQDLLDRLAAIVDRHNEVGKMITDPDVISDMKRYPTLMKEYKDLGVLVDKYHEYKKVNDDLSFKAYPNPSSDDLFLEMNAYRNEKLVYHLYDMQGKLIMTNPIESPKTQINMRVLAVGAYLIQIYNSKNQPIQTIQVIKD
jgi:protein subunit release factor A